MTCEDCKGTGRDTCPGCDGSGREYGRGICIDCAGRGHFRCFRCKGTGEVLTERHAPEYAPPPNAAATDNEEINNDR